MSAHANVFANGSSVPAPAVRDPTTGLCFFPDANCAAGGVFLNGTYVSCCEPSDYVTSGHGTSQVFQFCVQFPVFVLTMVILTKWLTAGEPEELPPSGLPDWLNKVSIYGSIGFAELVNICIHHPAPPTSPHPGMEIKC